MNIFPKHVSYLTAFAVILAIAAFCAATSFPEKTSAASARDSIAPSATTTETVEETVTLSASNLKTSGHGYQWWSGPGAYCGPPMHMFPSLDDSAGSVLAGYEHYYDKGAKVLGCPDGASAAFRGAVWFDLSSIASKAPPLHVSVKSALLHFKKDRECPSEELLIAKEDWLKGIPEDTLVAGDPLAIIPACAPPECVRDVTTVVNNWVRGEDHGGYQNYGFAIKGPIEGDHKFGDNDTCVTRYSDFSLTVTYKYDKEVQVFTRAAPQRPFPQQNLVTRKNVALAANGGVATAQNYTLDGVYPGQHFQPAYAIDGLRHTLTDGSSFWRDEHGLPSWLEVDFSGPKKIDEIDVITLQIPGYEKATDPTPTQTFTQQGPTVFEAQYWTGSAWKAVASISDNNLVWRKISFTAITTTKIRIVVNAASDGVARIVELEAWGK